MKHIEPPYKQHLYMQAECRAAGQEEVLGVSLGDGDDGDGRSSFDDESYRNL